MPRPPRPRAAISHEAALDLFDRKWVSLRRVIDYRAGKAGLNVEVIEELMQIGGLLLWQACVRGVVDVCCRQIARAAWDRWRHRRDRRQERPEADFDGNDDTGMDLAMVVAAAEPASVEVDGVSVTMQDVSIDHPDLVHLYDEGISTTETAAALGVTRQRVHQIAPSLGGVWFGSRWLFPADAPARFRALKVSKG